MENTLDLGEPENVDKSNLDHMRYVLERQRYQLELKKFAFDRYKFKREDRSLPRRLGLIVTMVVAAITAIISGATLLVQSQKNSLDREAAAERANREWKIQAAKLIADTKDQLFSKEGEKRALAIQVLKSALPHQTYNRVFGLAAENASESDQAVYRSAQTIDPRWPSDQEAAFGLLPKYAGSTPPRARQENGSLILTRCPPPSTKVEFKQLSDDEYLFTTNVTSVAVDDHKVDRMRFTPVHESFVQEMPNRPGMNFYSWLVARPDDSGTSKFAYIGKYPINKLRVEVYRGSNFPVCEHEVNLSHELGW